MCQPSADLLLDHVPSRTVPLTQASDDAVASLRSVLRTELGRPGQAEVMLPGLAQHVTEQITSEVVEFVRDGVKISALVLRLVLAAKRGQKEFGQ